MLEIKGEFCKVDYSNFENEEDYSKHIGDLADSIIPKIRAIHSGREADSEIEFVLVDDEAKKEPAWTGGKKISVNLSWFNRINDIYGNREADDGSIVHELDHAILWAKTFEQNKNKSNYNLWLIEGLADFVRNKLGYTRESKGDIAGSYPHFIKGRALWGYQASAHFLMYLENKRSTIINELYQSIVDDNYEKKIFQSKFGKKLDQLVREYELENEHNPLNRLLMSIYVALLNGIRR